MVIRGGAAASRASRPRVSICITACNRVQFVAQAIESALAQTYPDCEIVVIDDASDDGTFEALTRYSDPRIRLVRNPRRLGQAANRNRAVGLARGQLVKFLDDDDVLEPSCVSEMAELFQLDERVGFAFCRRRILVSENADSFAQVVIDKYSDLHLGFEGLGAATDGRLLLAQWVESGMRENWIGEPTAVMVRRDLLERSSGFSDRIRHIVDLDLWVRLIAETHVGFVDRELVGYRTGHAGVTQSNYATGRTWLDRLWMLENLCREVDVSPYPKAGAALLAERRAVWRTVLRLGRAPDGRRLPVAPYRHYLLHRARVAMGRSPMRPRHRLHIGV
jgi:glycosyltransferase involved in cell wall biosynthesis